MPRAQTACARSLIDDMRDRLTRRSTDLPALERDLAQLSKAVSETNRGWAMPMSALAFSQLVRGIMAHSVLIEPHASLLAKWQAATAGAICFFFFMSCVYPPSLLSWKAERLRQTSWRVRGERSYRNATIQDIDSYMYFVHATSLRGKLLGLPVVHQFVFVILFVMSTGVLMMWGAGWYASGDATGP